MSCCGNCGKCSGCAGSLELTQREMDFLRYLGQVAFLPVARSMGDLTPVYLEDGQEKQAENALLLQCLEKKGLISRDFDQPLKGFPMDAYAAWPIHGSMALTQRGQTVLQLLEYQGHQE